MLAPNHNYNRFIFSQRRVGLEPILRIPFDIIKLSGTKRRPTYTACPLNSMLMLFVHLLFYAAFKPLTDALAAWHISNSSKYVFWNMNPTQTTERNLILSVMFMCKVFYG